MAAKYYSFGGMVVEGGRGRAELPARFEKGGAYEWLEDWYEILRLAQDGDTVTAINANPNVGMSFTGTFMRSAEGKIQADMGGSLGIAPEIRFAYFGGIVRNQEGNVTGFGAYELREQEYAWRPAVVGGRRHGDMQSCDNVDCIAAAIDIAGMAGTGVQMISPACIEFQPACYGVSRTISWAASGAGALYTVANALQGDATTLDVAVTIGTTVVGGVTKDKRVSLGAGVAQFLWDVEISPYQR